MRQTTSEHKLKDDDEVVQQIETTNLSELLFFSNRCICYKMKTHELPDGKVAAMGEYLPSMLGLDEGERILYTVATTDYSGMMVFGFENGKAAKVELSNYATKTNRKKLVGAYSDKAPIASIRFIESDCDLVAYSDTDRAIVVYSEKIALKATKNTQGVQIMTLRKKGSKMTELLTADEANLSDKERYRPKNIPAAGTALSEKDMRRGQMTLFGDDN